ncbi:hypothetical protein K3495_g13020 [Podosphaera aphanis]|nr:hypothetical protein K3495_g13020 [Podosphaera aphanis]
MSRKSEKRETERMLELRMLLALDNEDQEALEEIGELLKFSLNLRYLNNRVSYRRPQQWDIQVLFADLDVEFKQAVRIGKTAFLALYNNIKDHLIFKNNSSCLQIPVAHQLALALERFGSVTVRRLVLERRYALM